MHPLVKYHLLSHPDLYDRVYRPSAPTAFALPVDVQADGDDHYLITAAVPGLRAEDLKIEVLGESLTLRGEIPAPAHTEASRWLMQERRYGPFARTLNFPVELNGDHAEASVAEGVLTLRLPKAETARPKQIKIKVK